MILLVLLLDLAWHGVIDQALVAQQKEKGEHFLLFQGLQDPFINDYIPGSQQEAEEEHVECCGSSKEKEEDIGQVSKSMFHTYQALGAVLGGVILLRRLWSSVTLRTWVHLMPKCVNGLIHAVVPV